MKLEKKKIQNLIRIAADARKFSYAPYSHFAVGAALLGADAKIYTGCNIENAAFTPGNCAERTAVFKAVSEGCREFTAIAIVGGKLDEDALAQTGYTAPCGVCRQVMAEFCAPDFKVFVSKKNGEYLEFTLAEILPGAFTSTELEKGQKKG